jgi:hypothetical protein
MNSSMSNFTPRAQQALALARREADRFHHNFVGTEHLLLGLVALGQGTAVVVIQKLGVNLETARAEVEKQVGTGPDQKVSGNIPYTPRVKKVLAFAQREAQSLNHTHVGTEHILLGILIEGDGVAARVLKQLGVDSEQARQAVLRELDPNATPVVQNPVTVATPQVRATGRLDAVDTSNRYDVHCAEGGSELVIYPNVLFKNRRRLFSRGEYDRGGDFLELELADGQTIHVAMASVIKFSNHQAGGSTPKSVVNAGEQPAQDA